MFSYIFDIQLPTPSNTPVTFAAFARARANKKWGGQAKSNTLTLVRQSDILPPYEPDRELMEQLVKDIGLATAKEVQTLIGQATIGLATTKEVQTLIGQATIGLATEEQLRSLQEFLAKANTSSANTTNLAKWKADETGARAYADTKIYSSYPPESVLEGHTAPFWYHNRVPELKIITFYVELFEAAVFERIEITFYQDNIARSASLYDDKSGEWLGSVSNFTSGTMTIRGTGIAVKRYRLDFSDKKTPYVAIKSIEIF